MQCEKCHLRSATVHLREGSTGSDTATNLCLACATKVLGQDLVGGEVVQLIGELVAKAASGLGAPAPAAPPMSPESAARTCSACGLTGTELAHLRRLGCPECYKVFGAELAALQGVRWAGRGYCGPAPGGAAGRAALGTDRELLQVELEQAVAEEAFERAAEIRDTLRRLARP